MVCKRVTGKALLRLRSEENGGKGRGRRETTRAQRRLLEICAAKWTRQLRTRTSVQLMSKYIKRTIFSTLISCLCPSTLKTLLSQSIKYQTALPDLPNLPTLHSRPSCLSLTTHLAMVSGYSQAPASGATTARSNSRCRVMARLLSTGAAYASGRTRHSRSPMSKGSGCKETAISACSMSIFFFPLDSTGL